MTTLSSFTVGNWSAAAFSAPGSMDFDHCAGETLYRSGITLGFKVTGAFLWSMYFYNPAWKLTPGASYPLAFTLDYSAPDTATAVAIGVSAVEVKLAPDMALFKKYVESEDKVEAASESFVFDLTDTSQLLPRSSELCPFLRRRRACDLKSVPVVYRALISNELCQANFIDKDRKIASAMNSRTTRRAQTLNSDGTRPAPRERRWSRRSQNSQTTWPGGPKPPKCSGRAACRPIKSGAMLCLPAETISPTRSGAGRTLRRSVHP